MTFEEILAAVKAIIFDFIDLLQNFFTWAKGDEAE